MLPALVVSVLVARTVLLGIAIGTVIEVDKKGFTLKPDYGENDTFIFGPDMGVRHNKHVTSNTWLGVKPEEIQKGQTVEVYFRKEGESLVCYRVKIIPLHLGDRYIDFSPMLARGKKKIAPCQITLEVASKSGYVGGANFTYKEEVPLETLRQDFKKKLTDGDWKVRATEDGKLVVQCYKDDKEPVNYLKIEAKGLPKEQQPRVTGTDPTKQVQPEEKEKEKKKSI